MSTKPYSNLSPSVSVVIPALNEAENLPFVLPRIRKWACEVILVEGDSTDRQPTDQALADWEADSTKRTWILEGEKNRLVMKLSVAACTGRLPTDLRALEACIALPQRIISGDPKVGMFGTGWAFWTQPGMERLARTL